MRETPSVVPDRIEPVVAYRYWGINKMDILESWGWSSCQWPIRAPLAAYHMYVPNSSIKYTSIPDMHNIYNCSGSKSKYDAEDFNLELYQCGIHAYKTPCTLGLSRYFTDTVVGQVYLWGLIIEHELGYRAQYAYPKCLYLDGKKDDIIRMIASNYRIPCIALPAVEPPLQKLPEDIQTVPPQYLTNTVSWTIGDPDAFSRDTGV